MHVPLKPLEEQVVVITGASSGIGLATTRALAERGAKLVLVARNEDQLHNLVEECRVGGAEAIAAPADVGRFVELDRVGKAAHERFGGFDTWINNAGVSIYGTCDENFPRGSPSPVRHELLGVVHGSLIAARHLRQKGARSSTREAS